MNHIVCYSVASCMGGFGLGMLIEKLFQIGVHEKKPPLFQIVCSEVASGMMMSCVTFWLLPEAMAVGGVLNAVFGTIMGLFLFSFYDRLLSKKTKDSHFFLSDLSEIAVLGLVLGTVLAGNIFSVISVCLIFFSYSAVCGWNCFGRGNTIKKQNFWLTLFGYGVVAATFSYAGIFLSHINQTFFSVSLGLGAGGILHLLLRQLFLESQSSHTLLTDCCYLAGLIGGILIK